MTTLTKTLVVAATGLLMSAGVALARPAIVTTDLNLRIDASVYAPVVIVLPVGATVEVHDCDGAWCAVSWRGYEGYASASYLDPLGYGRPSYYPPSPPPYYRDRYYGPPRYYRRDYDDRRRARRKRDRDHDRDRRRSRSRDRDDDRDRRRSRSRDRDDDRDRRGSRKRGRDRDDGNRKKRDGEFDPNRPRL